ncbi:hydroxypyruvate isomerase family protein [Rhodospirillaceae bacterium KN72]|uniref:Hydroxypyruvate isomerase family protein n=1 Tax=Pacificispira spongiicola TaxID=2729598 RepID=A0A7Y0E2J6_9PROT|nr:2-oxo-tetronate isomerase [Pacificispira spongiicola]NMM46067.1 hydroxypyruvate isomerase family protein [Pacificispira spongiicola]
MPRFTANLSMLFTELPMLERFSAAKEAGFDGVEIQFPYDFPTDELQDAKDQCGLPLVHINLPPGDWQRGDRGNGALPGREAEFERGFAKALEYAEALDCRKLHVMAGVAPITLDERVHHSTMEANLRRIAPRAAKSGIQLLVEPINTRDIPNYVLNKTEHALRIIDNVQASNIALQLDLYHRQIMQGDLIATLERCIDRIGHIQIAGVPGRNEPDTGEVNYEPVLKRLDTLGYDGWVGCEYVPRDDTWSGLGWMQRYKS